MKRMPIFISKRLRRWPNEKDKKKLFIFWFIFGLLSCSNPVHIKEESNKQFDLISYFSFEAERLNSNKTAITKKLIKNGITEIVKSDSIDWKAELQPFSQINFNKPALVNSFYTDSSVNNNKLILTYSAKDSILQLRKLVVYFTAQKPDSVIAILQSTNLYYRSNDTIAYFGNGNYRISATNKPRVGKEVAFVLTGKTEIE